MIRQRQETIAAQVAPRSSSRAGTDTRNIYSAHLPRRNRKRSSRY